MPEKLKIVAIKKGPRPAPQSDGKDQGAKTTTAADQTTSSKSSDAAISGRLEATIKINQVPESQLVTNNWHRFTIDCDGKQISVTVRPKVWNKFVAKAEEYDQWVAAIAGKVGAMHGNGFVLEQPNIQVFEKKPKADK